MIIKTIIVVLLLVAAIGWKSLSAFINPGVKTLSPAEMIEELSAIFGDYGSRKKVNPLGHDDIIRLGGYVETLKSSNLPDRASLAVNINYWAYRIGEEKAKIFTKPSPKNILLPNR